MKKELIVFLLFLLTIPLASSVINILGPEKDTYNLGSEITISGYIFSDNSFTGFLTLIIKCDSSSYQLPRSSISLNGGEKENFPEDFEIPKITISSSMHGTCYIEASLLDSSNNIKETTTSDVFQISKDLEGRFSIEQTKIQVGKILKITGEIKRLNGEPTDGSIEVYFKKNDTNTKYLADIFSFKDGQISYEHKPIATPAGTYTIDFFVNDIFGNSKLFEDTVSFTLVDEIYVTVNIDKSTVLPGDMIKISGEAKTILQEEIDSGNVRIELAGNVYKSKIKSSKFIYDLVIPNDIKTGKHTVIIRVDDKFGNRGYVDTTFNINPIATSMEIVLDKSSYKPSEKMEIQPILHDQANDIINEIVKLEVLDSDNEVIIAKDIKSGSKESLELSDYAPPGTYLIRASSKGIVKESGFTVESVVNLETELNNNTLIITNIGNIKYNEPIILDFNNGKFIITKRDTLNPEESLTIDLSEQVPSGDYNLLVKSGDFEQTFSNIVIIGKLQKSFNFIYYILISLFILIILFSVYIKAKKSKVIKYEYDKGRREGKALLKRIQEKKQESKKEFRFNPPKTETERKQHIEDFRSRILQEIKATQEKERKTAEDKKDRFSLRPVPERKIEPKEDSNNNMFN